METLGSGLAEQATAIVQEIQGESRKDQHLFLRGLLSLLQRRCLESNETSYTVEVLTREGLVSSGPDNRLGITVIGQQAAGKVGTFDRHLIHGLSRKFTAIPSSCSKERQELVRGWLKSVEEQQSYSQQRRVTFDPSSLLSNAIAVSASGRVRLLNLVSQSYAAKKDFAAKAEVARNVRKTLHDCYCIVIPSSSSVQLVILGGAPDLEQLQKATGLNPDAETKEVEFSELKPSTQIRLLEHIFGTLLEQQGLARIGRRYFDLGRSRRVRTPYGVVSVFEGFDLTVEWTKAGMSLFVEPCSTVFRRLSDTISDMRKPQADVKRILEGREVEVLPRRSRGKIQRLCFTQRERSDHYDLQGHWRKKYHISIHSELPVAEIQFAGVSKPYSYPCEVVGLPSDEQKDLFNAVARPERLTIDPKRRVGRIRDLLSQLRRLALVADSITIRLGLDLSTYADLRESGWCREAFALEPPRLTFSRDLLVTSSDPRTVFRRGPLSTANCQIWRMLVPRSHAGKGAIDFLKLLVDEFRENRFGTLAVADKPIVSFPEDLFGQPRSTQTETLRGILSEIPKPGTGIRSMVLGVCPNSRDNPFHDVAKVTINEILGIPDQLLTVNTFGDARKGERRALRLLALQLLIKSLSGRNGEVPWILSMPSDGARETVYVGSGFSMEPLTERRANAFFAACDSFGSTVVQRAKPIPYPTRYFDDAFLTDLFQAIGKTLKSVDTPQFKRLVLYRSGHLTDQEREALLAFRDKCSVSGEWSGIRIDVVTTEECPFRVFETLGGIRNPSKGICILRDDRTAILCLTDTKQGTVRPIRILLETPSSTIICDIVQEFYDRTCLNWMAPAQTGREPVELRIANNLAKISKYTSSEFNYLFV